MNFTERETAHVLAALRHCAKMDLTLLGHFDGVVGGQLSEEEVDDLAERFNFDSADSAPRSKSMSRAESDGKPRKYTVVGIHTNVDWEGGLHGASFVWHVHAKSPSEAAEKARCAAATGRVDDSDGAEATEETKEYAEGIAIIAVFEGYHLMDAYDPDAQ